MKSAMFERRFFLLVGGLLLAFIAYQRVYPRLLAFCLERKAMFLSVPVLVTLLGVIAWTGFDNVLRFAPDALRQTGILSAPEPLILLVMVFWLLRVLFTKWWRTE